jgi:hypothetical protein
VEVDFKGKVLDEGLGTLAVHVLAQNLHGMCITMRKGRPKE